MRCLIIGVLPLITGCTIDLVIPEHTHAIQCTAATPLPTARAAPVAASTPVATASPISIEVTVSADETTLREVGADVGAVEMGARVGTDDDETTKRKRKQ